MLVTVSEMLGIGDGEGGHKKITDPLSKDIEQLKKDVNYIAGELRDHLEKLDKLDTSINCTQKRCSDNHNDEYRDINQLIEKTDSIARNVYLQNETIIGRLDKLEDRATKQGETITNLICKKAPMIDIVELEDKIEKLESQVNEMNFSYPYNTKSKFDELSNRINKLEEDIESNRDD